MPSIFRSNGSAAERLAAYLCFSCLGRPASREEFGYALTDVGRDPSGAGLAIRLFTSPDFQRTSALVAVVLETILQQPVSFVSWRHYRRQLVSGEASVDDILRSLMGVVAARRLNLSAIEIVRRSYRTALVREPGMEEEHHAVKHFESGADPIPFWQDLAVKAVESGVTSTHREAFLLYAALLSRESQASERSMRAEQLAGGLGVERLVKDMMGSQELAALLESGNRQSGGHQRSIRSILSAIKYRAYAATRGELPL